MLALWNLRRTITDNKPRDAHRRHLMVAVFPTRSAAENAVERLIDRDFPMDMLSILGKSESAGDDLLGIYYTGVGERMKGWGALGAFWGGLWGLLAGAAGMFVIPGLGAVLAAGPIVEAIAGSIVGATVTGGAMAGAAALSQLAIALHRMGVPKERLQDLHQAIKRGRYVVILRCGNIEEAKRWQSQLGWCSAEMVEVFALVP